MATDFKALEDQQIVDKLHQNQHLLVNARFKHSANLLENTSTLRNLRRDIARLKTEARRRELERGLAPNSLITSLSPSDAASGKSDGDAAPVKGGFLQGLVDKAAGND